MSQAATQTSNACPGTPAQAIAELPAEMRTAQIQDQASSVSLVSQLNSTIPLTAASIKQYYSAHTSQYDTICVAVAVVQPANVTAFAAAQAQGLSVAALAKRFSVDPSAAQGGALGCISPTSTSYINVRTDVGTTAVGHFTTTPRAYTSNGVQYALYFAATKKTVTPLAQAQGVVISDIQTNNATGANNVKANILYQAAVAVDPQYGRWGLSSSGPSIFVPALPTESGPDSTTNWTPEPSQSYQ